jgi:alkylation response protein AidB-like acyl-CoA dehydrogenase
VGGGPDPRDFDSWRARARAFAERAVLPRAAQIDREDRLPAGLVDAMAAEGFLGLNLPTEYGGLGCTTRSTAAVFEELSRGSAAVAVTVSVHLAVCGVPIAEWGTPEQKARYLPPLAAGRSLGAFALTEPGVGSDTQRLETRYEAAEGGYRLRGSKMFISNAVAGGTVLVFATHDPSLGSKGITAFVVQHGTPGFRIASRLEKLGMRGSDTTELVFEDARVDSDARLGPEGAGLRVALGALTGGRVGIAACAVGVAQAAFDELLVNARSANDAASRSAVARAFAELSAARALVERAATARDAGEPFDDLASAAKLFASQAAVRIANAGVDVAGAAGTLAGSRAGQLLRDARVFPIVEGTTEIQEYILGRALLPE